MTDAPIPPKAPDQAKPGSSDAKHRQDQRETRNEKPKAGQDQSKETAPRGVDKFKQTVAAADSAKGADGSSGNKLDRMKTLVAQANDADSKDQQKKDGTAMVSDAKKGAQSVDATEKKDRATTKPESWQKPRETRIKSDSATDRAEKSRVANPKDGVGFPHDKDSVDRGALKSFLDRQPDEKTNAVREGRGWIEVTTSASRDGSAEYNQDLSERRADNLQNAIADELGVDPQSIFTIARGESDSTSPDGKDNADDRVGRITFHEDAPKPGDVPSAYKAASDALPKFELDKNAQEQAKMALDHVKKAIEKIAKEGRTPAQVEKILVKEAGKFGLDELKWMGNKLADDMRLKDLKTDIQANAVPGLQDALADFAGVQRKADGTRSANFRGERSAVYKLAYDNYTNALTRLSKADQANLKQVMRTPDQRRKLDVQLERNWVAYSGRGVKQ